MSLITSSIQAVVRHIGMLFGLVDFFLFFMQNNIFIWINLKVIRDIQIRKMCKKNSVRGALIVLEGCDRSGKTTQCKQLGKI